MISQFRCPSNREWERERECAVALLRLESRIEVEECVNQEIAIKPENLSTGNVILRISRMSFKVWVNDRKQIRRPTHYFLAFYTEIRLYKCVSHVSSVRLSESEMEIWTSSMRSAINFFLPSLIVLLHYRVAVLRWFWERSNKRFVLPGHMCVLCIRNTLNFCFSSWV